MQEMSDRLRKLGFKRTPSSNQASSPSVPAQAPNIGRPPSYSQNPSNNPNPQYSLPPINTGGPSNLRPTSPMPPQPQPPYPLGPGQVPLGGHGIPPQQHGMPLGPGGPIGGGQGMQYGQSPYGHPGHPGQHGQVLDRVPVGGPPSAPVPQSSHRPGELEGSHNKGKTQLIVGIDFVSAK